MTIVQVWKEIGENEKHKIIARIVADGVTLNTAYSYVRGDRTPLKLYRESIAKHIKFFTGQNVTATELWPEAS